MSNQDTTKTDIKTAQKRKRRRQAVSYSLGSLMGVVAAALYVYGYPEAAGLLSALAVGTAGSAHLPRRGAGATRGPIPSILVLAGAVVFGGCTPPGFVRADAALDLFTPIKKRHDAAVILDSSLDDEHKASALRSSELLETYFREAIKAGAKTGENPAREKGD